MINIYDNIKQHILNFLIVCGLKKSKGGKYFVSKVSLFAPWVYVSYIPGVLCKKCEKKELMRHSNKQEMLAMVKVFNKLGYNVFVQDYSSKIPYFPKINVKLVFGLEPIFEQACIHYPKAKKIYYATGSYYKFQNDQLVRYTDYVNAKCGTDLPYVRYVTPHDSVEVADAVLQIGNNATIQTYPENLRDKILCIHQSTQVFSTPPIVYSKENEFLFVASEGNVLKGSFLLIEYFSQHPELTLHWVGPIEDDFRKATSAFMTNNIKTYGFLRWDSLEMLSIVKRCNFIIYPSATEGGCSGSVLCAMKCGLIPILSYNIAFDEISDLGFVISDSTIAEIDKAVKAARALNTEQVEKLKHDVYTYTLETYNLEKFQIEFESYIRNQMC